MKVSYLKIQRAKELADAFFKVWEKGMTPCQAMRAAVTMPCSRFWISPETARRYLVGGWGKPVTKERVQMLAEIARRCKGNHSLENVQEVVESPAPQFYMKPDTARKIIQRELKRRRQCKREKRQ